jgi:hypothetical protein
VAKVQLKRTGDGDGKRQLKKCDSAQTHNEGESGETTTYTECVTNTVAKIRCSGLLSLALLRMRMWRRWKKLA